MSTGVLSYLRRLLPTTGTELPDDELVGRFAATGEPAAFTELLRRHGPLVWGVCRRVLGNAHAAEDAFQATFLQLAQQADKLGRNGSVAGWLHTVAARLARRAWRADERRRRRDRAHGLAMQSPADDRTWRELRQLLDVEIARLPEPYRQPLILCYLENRPQAEAARCLGLAPAALRGRLERGRQKLRRRLENLGLPLAAALLLTRADPVPASLCDQTLQTVSSALAGGPVPSAVAALTAGGTLLSRLTIGMVAAGLLVAGVLGFGGASPRAEPAVTLPPAEPSAQVRHRVDALGDPLPEGALLRLGTTRFRGPSSVEAIALSPDGKLLATAGSRTVRVWDATTGKQSSVLPEKVELSIARQDTLVFSADGGKVYFPERDVVVALDLASGKIEAAIPNAPPIQVHSVHPSPDGTLLAVGTNKGVQVIKRATGRTSWSTPNRLDSFPLQDKDDRLLIHGPYSLGLFAPDGKTVAVYASDSPKTLRLLETATGAERQQIALGARLVRFTFSPDSHQVAVNERDNAVRVYDAATGQRLHSWTMKLTNPYENYLLALAYSPDGATLAVGATDHLVHLWDVRTGRELPPLRGHTWYITGLVFSLDGRLLYSTGWDGSIRRWEVATWREKPAPGDPATGTVARSTVGSVLAWEGAGGVLHLGDAVTGKTLRTLPGNPAGFSKLKFSPDGSILAAGGNDLSMQLWEVASGKLLRQWSWPKGKDPHADVDDIAFTADGNLVATARFRTNEVLLWDVATGARLARAPHQMGFGAVFTPDGKTLVSVGWDRAMRWWRLPNLQPLDAVILPERMWVPNGDTDARLHAVAYSPDGRRLATIDLCGTISVWDAATHKVLHSFPAAMGQCNIAFSPDSQWLTTSGYSGELALWEARSGRQVLRLAGHPGRIFSVAFGPDGRTLLTGSDDSTGLVWDLRPKTESKGDTDPAALWDALASTDAPAAYRAVWQLADQPERAVSFLKGKLAPVKAIDPARLRGPLDRLDSDKFTEREKASRKLAALGEAAEPELRRELGRATSAEKRHRLQMLVDGLTPSDSPDEVRRARAVVVLKWVKTPAARQLLGVLAGGAPDARLTQDAKAALRFLDQFSSSPLQKIP
jgi:RNA polymerase sigma factor (sigma-70 family)